ncbi:MAG: TonB family protein [Steroidobacteraceae bacterium]
MSISDVDVGSIPVAQGGDLKPVSSETPPSVIARAASKRRAAHQTKVRESAARPAPAKSSERAYDTTTGVPIVVLSTDAELCDAIRGAVQERHPVVIASRLEEAEEHAANGRCGVLITDQLSSQPMLRKTMGRIRARESALVVIAVGNRGDENALASLLSADIVDRLMLKPVTPALAQILIKSAAQQFRTLKGPAAPAATQVAATPAGSSAPPAAQTQPLSNVSTKLAAIAAKITALPRPPWLTAAAAAAVAAAVVWSVMFQKLPDIDPREVIANNLVAAQRAVDEGRLVDPSGRSAVDFYNAVLALDPANTAAQTAKDRIGDRFVAEAEASLAQGQIAAAIVALQSVRRVQPEHQRLPALETGLRIEQEKYVLAFRTREAAAAAERERAAAATTQLKATRVTPPAPVQRTPTEQKPGNAPAALAKQTPPLDRVEIAAGELPRVDAPSSPAPESKDASIAAALPQPVREAGSNEMNTAPGAPSASSRTPATTPLVTPPSLVKFVRPQYPQDALITGVEGWVDVSLTVTPSGDVIDPRVEESSQGRLFDRAALAAVRKWKYERRPADDAALAQRFRVRVAFQIENRRGR